MSMTHQQAERVAAWARTHDWARDAIPSCESQAGDVTPQWGVKVFLSHPADADETYMGGHAKPDRRLRPQCAAVFNTFKLLRDWAGY